MFCDAYQQGLHLSEMLLRMELKGYENNFLVNNVTKLRFVFLIEMMPVADPVRVDFSDEVGFLTSY